MKTILYSLGWMTCVMVFSFSTCSSEKETSVCDNAYTYESVSWIHTLHKEIDQGLSDVRDPQHTDQIRTGKVKKISAVSTTNGPAYIFKTGVKASDAQATHFGEVYSVYDCSFNALFVSDVVDEKDSEQEEFFVVHDAIVEHLGAYRDIRLVWE